MARKKEIEIPPVVVTPEIEEETLPAGIIRVRPVYSYMWNPIEMLGMREGVFTLVEKNSWIDAQIAGGLLVAE